MGEVVGDMDVVTDKIIDAFEGWFSEDFEPHPDYVNEAALQKDLQAQLDSWVREAFPGWRARDRRVPAYRGPFGYRYRPDIEVLRNDDEFVPIEVELMKDASGWKPSEAIGQAIMFSRVLDTPRAIAAVLDMRQNPPAYGEVEKALQRELWEKLGVRLCVRKR